MALQALKPQSFAPAPLIAGVADARDAVAAGPHPLAATQQLATYPSKEVAQVLEEEHAIEGPGFEICRPFPTQSMKNFDPWLLVDAFGPKHVAPGDALLKRTSHLGQHPHRGFQAITYHIAGSYDHYDSTGKHGRLEAGTVQLMTAGGGIVHGGAPTFQAIKEGTFLHGYQIWLALPAAQRLCPADTLDLHADQTPVVTSPEGGVRARVISSTVPVYGAKCSKLPTAQPIMMVHYVVQPGAVVRQPVPRQYNTMLHVSIGEGRFGPGLRTAASAEHAVLFKQETSKDTYDDSQDALSLVEFSCPADAKQPLDVLLLAGRPTGERIVQYGPFVGGSMSDIKAAQADYQEGKMGALASDGSAAPRSLWAR